MIAAQKIIGLSVAFLTVADVDIKQMNFGVVTTDLPVVVKDHRHSLWFAGLIRG